MKRKYLPLILMLLAGAITAIITYVKQYAMIQRLSALLAVLLVFYVLGSIFVWLLDTFEKQNEKAALDEGEVIEKEVEAADDTEEASESEDTQEE
ncbi:MAG: hypothetical protein J1E65_03025 [Lachnospiraceae bacterium]|nr:hypothetical protein [Lachnospiraceae bacterium]